MAAIRCPGCSTRLTRSDDAYSCPGCGKSFPDVGGITQLAGTTSFYYNLFSRDVMRGYLSMADRAGWANAFYALQRSIPRNARDIYDTVLGEQRAAWRFLLPLDRAASVLDFGCGLGALTLALAPHCGELVAVDLTRERLTSLRAAADHYGLHNVQLIHGGDVLVLPFVDQQFDIVLLNGVLEWLPESFPGDPRAVQSEFLQEVRRVLKPDGIVYIGIENRFAYSYLREREDHTGLYWSSLMPRFVANAYSRWTRGKPYRTYTYTYRGYRRLLQESGFPSIHCYSPLPDYRHPERLVDLDDPQQLEADAPETSGIKQRLKSNQAFLRRFAHSFSLLASPAPQVKRGFLDDLRREIAQHTGSTSARLTRYAVTGSGIILFCTLESDGGQDVIIRLPLHDGHAARIHNNATALQQLSETRGLLGEGVDVPKLLFEGRIQGQYATVESRILGIDLGRIVTPGRISPEILALGDSMLEFAKRTASSDPGEQSRLVSYLSRLCDRIGDRLVDRSLSARFNSVGAAVLDGIAATPIPVVRAHGDLNLGNCLWDVKQRRLTGIVDWDHYSELALPGWDLISILLHLRLTRGLEGRGERVVALLAEEWREYEWELWNPYADALALDSHWRSLIILTAWMNTLDTMLGSSSRGLDYAWIEANVRPVLEQFERFGTGYP